jgi:hypothetical protein
MRYLALEITRFFAEETRMDFIAGPRQVGKGGQRGTCPPLASC